MIPSQNLQENSSPPAANDYRVHNSTNCPKIESSKSMGHITNSEESREVPAASNRETQKAAAASHIPHSNTFHHQNQQPPPKDNNNSHHATSFIFNHLFHHSAKSGKKLVKPSQPSGASKDLSTKESSSSTRGEKHSAKETRNRSVKAREKQPNSNEARIEETTEIQNGGTAVPKKSLSCFNFNQSLVSKPVTICAPSANEYENTSHKLGKDFYTKFSSLAVKTEAVEEVKRKESSNSGRSVNSSKSRKEPSAKAVIKQSQSSSAISRTVTITASTSELLKCLAIYLSIKCRKLAHFHGNEVILWLRTIDRALLVQGWQDIAFISPANVVFVYLLLRDYISDKIKNVEELQAIVLTCLYLSYSYVGNEISYPLKPFLVETDRRVFWSRCVGIINESSAKMLLINQDPAYFTHIFTELKQYGDRGKSE